MTTDTVSRPEPGEATTPTQGLRPWQQQALQAAERPGRRDVLIAATPGSGKTRFALTVAGRAIRNGWIDRVVVVAPTDHLRTQWADAAADSALVLDPTLGNNAGRIRPGTHGYVTTYAQVASNPGEHRERVRSGRTLAVFDEIHHAGDGQTWGAAVRFAFNESTRRLALSGTPFRTGTEQIPFVTYQESPDGLTSVADYTYGYRQALADGVVRPVMFAAYTGTARWRNNAGEVITGAMSQGPIRTELETWRAALDPAGSWVPHVIAAVDQRITDLRRHGIPDAAGLLLASDQDTARAYARIVADLTGHPPVLALSDDPDSSNKIAAFRESADRIIVAVRQVSEGVDIPRLCVLGWLTSYRTPLFFAQAVGRVVRARRRGEAAAVFLPAVRPLLALAAELETERNHVIAPPPDPNTLDVDEEAESPEPEPAVDGPGRAVLESQAAFAHVLADGRAYTPPPLPDDDGEFGLFGGVDGLLTPAQTAALLASRDAKLRETAHRDRSTGGADGEPAGWRGMQQLRKDINRQVARIAARSGRPHGQVHNDARRAVPGPPTAQAGLDVLTKRLDWLKHR